MNETQSRAEPASFDKAPSAPKHTPGPWYEASTGNHQGLVISEATSANVAVAYDSKDARLIAAAPDLLRACLAASAYLVEPRSAYFENRAEAERIIREAIAKAQP